jgi:hypothetical protein
MAASDSDGQVIRVSQESNKPSESLPRVTVESCLRQDEDMDLSGGKMSQHLSMPPLY